MHGARHHGVWDAAAGLQTGEPRLAVDHSGSGSLGAKGREDTVGQGADVEAPVGLRLGPGVAGQLSDGSAEDVAPAQRSPREYASELLGTPASRMSVKTLLEPALALVTRYRPSSACVCSQCCSSSARRLRPLSKRRSGAW